MKKISKLVMFIITVTSLLCITVFISSAETYSGKCGANVTWSLDTQTGILDINGTGAIQDYTWTNAVPTTPWYQYRTKVKKIVVHDGITTIGSSAFFGLHSVNYVEISDDVLSIKNYAFAFCSGLREIKLPENLQYIGGYCFEFCSGLISAVIPDSVTKLDGSIFYGCSQLSNIELPSKIANLPEAFFSKCTALKSFEVPETVTSIGSNCFKGCSQLETVKLPNCLEKICNGAFSDCISLIDISIPNSVSIIEYEAFKNCNSLKEIVFPGKMTEISSSVCFGCSELFSVIIPDNVTKIGSKAFYDCYNLENVVLNNRLKQIGTVAFYNCSNLKKIFLPDSIRIIEDKAIGFYKDIFDEVTVIPDLKLYCVKNSEGYTYAGKNSIPYSIIDIKVPYEECKYTGKPITPNFLILVDNKQLVYGSDYSISFQDNMEIGTAIANIVITNSDGNFSIKKEFNIGLLLTDFDIVLSKGKCQYKTLAPEVSVKNGNDKLKYGQDYKVIYDLSGETKEKTNADTSYYLWGVGECKIIVIGCNKYIGEEVFKVTINKFDISKAIVSTDWKSCGDGSYECQAYKTSNYVYDGAEKKQKGFMLWDECDTIPTNCYKVSYKNNIMPGKASMIISGTGRYYSGTKTLSFKIAPKQVNGLKVSSFKTTSLTLSWSKVTGAKYYKLEKSTDGKKWTTVTTTDKTSYTVKSLKAGTKYQFRVTALDSTKKIAGKSSAVLKTATLTGAPSVTLKSSKSKTATASWKKVTGASKYVVYKSTDGKKWTKVTTTTKTTYTLTKLTGGKKIYVKVTALNAYGKASAASTAKKVTVKK